MRYTLYIADLAPPIGRCFVESCRLVLQIVANSLRKTTSKNCLVFQCLDYFKNLRLTPIANDNIGAPSNYPSTPPPVFLQHQSSDVTPATTNAALRGAQASPPLATSSMASNETVETWRYTNALHSYAQVKRKGIQYQEIYVSYNPNIYKWIASIGDVSGEGTHRDSRQAKHLASKQVCILLDIHVTA
jgi:hypothetical protein